jgi:hypothetical protein
LQYRRRPERRIEGHQPPAHRCRSAGGKQHSAGTPFGEDRPRDGKEPDLSDDAERPERADGAVGEAFRPPVEGAEGISRRAPSAVSSTFIVRSNSGQFVLSPVAAVFRAKG